MNNREMVDNETFLILGFNLFFAVITLFCLYSTGVVLA